MIRYFTSQSKSDDRGGRDVLNASCGGLDRVPGPLFDAPRSGPSHFFWAHWAADVLETDKATTTGLPRTGRE